MKASFDTGVVPDDWKTANVCPIFKKGSKSQIGNYRPVSLTSQICKVFETVICDAIVLHLKSNGLLDHSQHGFRKGGSCISNLLEFLDYVTKNLDNRNSVDVIIYLDFAKDFDKVPHCPLLEKINKHGISGKVLNWLREWLRGRKQRVCINGHFSSWTAVTSGVPQGSVLGPVLFLIFINDIDSNLLCAISKFADDTKLSNAINCNKDMDQLQSDLLVNGQPSGKFHSMIQSAVLCISVGTTISLIILSQTGGSHSGERLGCLDHS